METATPPLTASASASASATATRFAAHWVADTLAGDEGLEFSVLKALVGASPECLTGAPEATRERVALRCLQEVSAVTATGGDAAATAGVLRVDDARSCEDLLLQLIGEVGRSGNLEKDLLPPFSQDIQNIICIKKPTLPQTSFDLLKEVDPRITSMSPPLQLEQNATNQHDDDQSLCSSHNCTNIERPRLPTDSAELQQETLANLVDEIDASNHQKDPNASDSVLHQSCTSNSRSFDPPQEDAIDAVKLGAMSPERSPVVEGSMSVRTVPASAGCEVALQGNITDPFSKQGTEDHATIAEPQSCSEKSPNLPHCINGEGPHDDVASNQSPKDALPTDASEPGHLPERITSQNTAMISPPHSSKTHQSALQHESGEEVNQDMNDVCASVQPMNKDHNRGELNLQAASVLPSESCNAAIQGGNSENNHGPPNATEHTVVFEERNGDESRQEVSGVTKDNQSLTNDSNILKNNAVHGGLNTPTAPTSQNCNIPFHDKISEAICLSEQNTRKNGTDIQKSNCNISIPSSVQDRDNKGVKMMSNKENFRDPSAKICSPSSDGSFHDTAAAAGLLSMADKIPFCTNVQDIDDPLGDLTQQDLCIKCGKDGQLLKCSGCLLTAHGSCFGSSVTFEDSGLFYCPVCFYTKATEAYQKAKKTYSEARKNLAAFLGTTQLVNQQHDELLTGVLPGSASREDHSNGCDTSKRNNIQQNEADNLAHQDKEPPQHRKKQKINATGHQDEKPQQQRKKQKMSTTHSSYPEEVVTEEVPIRDSDVAPMNKHSILQNNSSKQVQDAEKLQQVENKEGREEAGNDNSSHGARTSSQKACGPSGNQEIEADKEDVPMNSHHSDDSDEIEATSSSDSGKRSSPPWRNMRHKKARLQEKETVVSSNSGKTMAQQDQHMPSSSRKRNYAYPQKRYSNPVAPSGRRTKLCWAEEETAALKEAMEKFAPRDDGPIPWVQILEYGRGVFHKTRLPADLRVKWRNMKKAGY